MLRNSRYFLSTVMIFFLCGSAMVMAKPKPMEKINETCGPYTVNMTLAGTINSISFNGEKILKRGLFFMHLKGFRDSQWAANKQGAKSEVKAADGKKIITSRGVLKERGDNVEYAQQITIDPVEGIDVRLKIKYLLDESRNMQCELMFADSAAMYGKKATAAGAKGENAVNTIPSDNFKNCDLVRSYFKSIRLLSSFAIETNKGLLTFEFIDCRGRLFMSKKGGLNWIISPLSRPVPGSVINLHYKISLRKK